MVRGADGVYDVVPPQPRYDDFKALKGARQQQEVRCRSVLRAQARLATRWKWISDPNGAPMYSGSRLLSPLWWRRVHSSSSSSSSCIPQRGSTIWWVTTSRPSATRR